MDGDLLEEFRTWGSFTYKQEEDALRVTVKPQAAELHDALAYDFDDVKPDSTVVTMRWEKVAVPFKVQVNVNDLVTASIRKQLHGLNQYYWEGWDDAAGYFLANKINLDEALKDEDQSIQAEERYDNLMNKSNILDAMGRKEDATSFRNKALDKGNALQLYVYGRQLQGDKKQDEALAIFRSNAKKFPDYWTSHLGLARVYSAQGDFDNAVKEVKLSSERSAGCEQDEPGDLCEAVAEQRGYQPIGSMRQEKRPRDHGRPLFFLFEMLTRRGRRWLLPFSVRLCSRRLAGIPACWRSRYRCGKPAGVGVGGNDQACDLRAHVRAPREGVREEEALPVGPAVRALIVERLALLLQRRPPARSA